LLLGTGAVAAGAERPNILVIMGDDIGIWNISRYSIGQWLFEILPAITEPEQLDDLLPQNIDPRDLRSPEI